MRWLNWLGVVIWTAGLTAGIWAPHRPPLVLGSAGLVLGVIGLMLFNWPDP